MTKIVALQSENVKRLKAVNIEPDGSLVIIGGRNAQGKTSVLDSIMYALAGGRALPKRPLRDGENYGKVRVELDDGLVVTRSFTEDGGGNLRVESTDGEAMFRAPQKLLDKLVGQMTFDPLGFDDLKPQERLTMLAEIVGLDLTKLEGKRAKAFEDRKIAGRELKQISGALAEMGPADSEAPAAEVSISDLTLELEKADGAVRTADDKFRKLTMGREIRLESLAEKARGIEAATVQIAELGRQIATIEQGAVDLEKSAAAMREEAPKLDQSIERAAADCGSAQGERAAIQESLRNAEGLNIRARANATRTLQATKLEEKDAAHKALTKKIKAIDEEKAAALRDAKLPIEGLAFGDDDVLFQNQPWEQASLAERIRVSVAMGFALNPKLRVLLVRDGSGLDQENLALVAELAEAAQGQLWIERVGDQDEAAVVIEDGMVRGVPSEEGTPGTPDVGEGVAAGAAEPSPQQPDLISEEEGSEAILEGRGDSTPT